MGCSTRRRSNRPNPASAASRRATDSGRPSVPRPAPSGADSAARQARHHADPVHQGGHRIARHVLGERVEGLDVDEQPRAVGRQRLEDRARHPGRVGHVVDAVERGDEAQPVVGRRSARPADRRSARWSARARGGAVRRDRGRGARCRSPRTTTPGTLRPAASRRRPPRSRCRRRRSRRPGARRYRRAAARRRPAGAPGSRARTRARRRSHPRRRSCRSRGRCRCGSSRRSPAGPPSWPGAGGTVRVRRPRGRGRRARRPPRASARIVHRRRPSTRPAAAWL